MYMYSQIPLCLIFPIYFFSKLREPKERLRNDKYDEVVEEEAFEGFVVISKQRYLF